MAALRAVHFTSARSIRRSTFENHHILPFQPTTRTNGLPSDDTCNITLSRTLEAPTTELLYQKTPYRVLTSPITRITHEDPVTTHHHHQPPTKQLPRTAHKSSLLLPTLLELSGRNKRPILPVSSPRSYPPKLLPSPPTRRYASYLPTSPTSHSPTTNTIFERRSAVLRHRFKLHAQIHAPCRTSLRIS